MAACRKVIREEALPAASARCRVVPAKLGEAIGDYASLSVAAEALGDGEILKL